MYVKCLVLSQSSGNVDFYYFLSNLAIGYTTSKWQSLDWNQVCNCSYGAPSFLGQNSSPK